MWGADVRPSPSQAAHPRRYTGPEVDQRNRHHPTGRSLIRIAAMLGVTVLLGACAPPLLSPDEPRSPFDRYDAVRNQRADQYIFDDYGRRRPDLKRRLTPRE